MTIALTSDQQDLAETLAGFTARHAAVAAAAASIRAGMDTVRAGQLRRRGKSLGGVSMCAGGSMGSAMVIETR